MGERENRILVVDDDDAIRALLQTILRRRGYQVDAARNGTEALELFGDGRHVLMLLDLMMPSLNGWEVLSRLEQLAPEVRPLVLVLTAGNEPRDLNPDIVAGTVRKPFDVQMLLETVIACMGMLQAARPSGSHPAPNSLHSKPPSPNKVN